MIQVITLIDWLQTLEPTDIVGIDDGFLQVAAPEGILSMSACIRVGGLPEDEEWND